MKTRVEITISHVDLYVEWRLEAANLSGCRGDQVTPDFLREYYEDGFTPREAVMEDING